MLSVVCITRAVAAKEPGQHYSQSKKLVEKEPDRILLVT